MAGRLLKSRTCLTPPEVRMRGIFYPSQQQHRRMIHYLLVQNRQGKTRLSKWWTPYTEDEQRKLANEVHRVVNGRESKFTNFVEFRNHKLVYRRYAGMLLSLALSGILSCVCHGFLSVVLRTAAL
jgi:hypothetical protein